MEEQWSETMETACGAEPAEPREGGPESGAETETWDGQDGETLTPAAPELLPDLLTELGETLAGLRRAEGERQLDAQFAQIRQLDPSLTQLTDLKELDSFGRFHQLVMQGVPLPEAFKAANYDRLVEQRTRAAEQAALNAARGKRHLAAPGGGARNGSGGLTDQELEEWARWGFDRKEAVRYHERWKRER